MAGLGTLSQLLVARSSSLRPGPGTSGRTLESLRFAMASELAAAGVDDEVRLADADVLEAARAYFEPAAMAAALAEIGLGERVTVVRHDELDELSGGVGLADAGWQATRRIGPFVDEFGRHVWFDLYSPAARTTLHYPGEARPALVMTAARRPTVHGRTYRLDLEPGTIWILARLLAPEAAVDGYVGFRVTAGSVTLPAEPGIVADRLTLAAPGKIGLRLDLAPAVPLGDRVCDPGEVAGPTTLTLTIGTITAASGAEGRSRVGGAQIVLTAAAGIAADARWQAVGFAADATPGQVDLAGIDFGVASLAGLVDIATSRWAVPVTRPADHTALGEADPGASGWLFDLVGDASVRWLGAPASAPIEGLSLLATPHRLVLRSSTSAVVPVDIHQTFDLWRMTPSAQPLPLSVRVTAPFDLTLSCDTAAGHALAVSAHADVALDRPVTAVGAVFPPLTAPVHLVIASRGPTKRAAVIGRGKGRDNDTNAWPLALENGYFRVASPVLVFAAGTLDGAQRLSEGALSLRFEVLAFLPTLPDPYVANLAPHGEFGHQQAGMQLLATVSWGADGNAEVAFGGELTPSGVRRVQASPRSTRPSRRTSQNLPSHGPVADRTRELAKARQAWERAAEKRVARARAADEDGLSMLGRRAMEAGVSFPDGFRLLDVSTRRHLVGVQLLDDREIHGGRPPLVADGMAVATRLAAVHVLMLPQVQWEPVVTLDRDQDLLRFGYFPTPLAAADDGGATLIASRSQRLAPVVPDVAVDAVIDAFAAGERTALTSTLPFGIKALFTLRPGDDGLALNEATYGGPAPLSNALQIRVRAHSGVTMAGEESPSFEGAAVQIRNGVDLLTGAPQGISVLGSPNDPGGSVEKMFNNEFAAAFPRVPVVRLDLSGYGASTFSDWVNPFAAFAEASKVLFQVLVGRTALEIVKFNSVLYPWGIRVTRMVTIERRPGGGVIRRDSGWQPESDGLFDFRFKDKDTKILQPSPYVVHPGIFRGLVNVRNIRPAPGATPVVFTSTSGKAAEVLAYHFDAEALLESGSDEIRARSDGMLGFLHVRPVGQPLTPADLASVVTRQSTIGGPVDVPLRVGASGLRTRALRLEVDVAGGVSEFVVVARGAPVFGTNGAWSVVRQPRTPSPGPSDAESVSDGAPLLREGTIRYLPSTPPTGGRMLQPAPAGPYRFSDGCDLFAAANPAREYGFLQTTPTHAFLYRRPQIVGGDTRITSTLPPLFADIYARSTAPSLFPPAANAIELRDRPYVLATNPATGLFRLEPPVSLAAPRADLAVGTGVEQTMRLVYNESHLSLSIEETSWSVDFPGLVMWTGFPDLPNLIGTRSRLTGSSGGRSVIDEIDTLIADWVDTMLSFAPGMSPRERPPAVDLTASNLKLGGKLSAAFFFERDIGVVEFKGFGKVSFGGESTETPGHEEVSLGLVIGFNVQGNIPLGGIFFLVLGLEMEIGGKVFLAGPQVGKGKPMIEIKVYGGVGFGTTNPVVKLYGFIAGGLAIERDSGGWRYGGLGLFEAEGSVIGLVKCTIGGEFVGIGRREGGKTITEFTGELAINVKVCVFLSIEMAWQFGWEQEM